jgi:hypothetical protein
MDMNARLQDLELLESVSHFTLEHPHPQVADFKSENC